METRTYTDQLGRQVSVPFPPRRIVSLVPSQTELLYDLGLDNAVAGITKFCVHPSAWFREKPRVGGTKQLHLDKIHALQPDLIIANKEENLPEQVQALMPSFPVWVSDIHTLEDALAMITAVGDMTGKSVPAAALVKRIRDGFSIDLPPTPIRTAYFIWRSPWMVAGGDTFIHEMMKACGLMNAFAHLPRYPEISAAQLQAANCELVLLSSEPYPFSEKHLDEFRAMLPQARIQLVDGEMFSWYGSRLQYAPGYFRQLKEKWHI